MSADFQLDHAAISAALHAVYIPRENTRLREEEAQKVLELKPLFHELEAALAKCPRDKELVLVDAAAGRGYVSLLSTRLWLKASGRTFRWHVIEREARRAEAVRSLAEKEGFADLFIVHCGDVGDRSLWPEKPDIVVGLHACGPAADLLIERSCGLLARQLLLVPCCVSKTVGAHASAEAAAQDLLLAKHAPVRRRFLEAMIASERTHVLEAAGHLVDVLEFCPPTVTPHNLLWRCRRIDEPGRMARAQRGLDRLRGPAVREEGDQALYALPGGTAGLAKLPPSKRNR